VTRTVTVRPADPAISFSASNLVAIGRDLLSSLLPHEEGSDVIVEQETPLHRSFELLIKRRFIF
jgi:hypothetical protein